MRRYFSLAGAILAVFLTAYLLVEALHIELLADPAPALRDGPAGGLLGTALLVADAFLPVASSLVMVALGALYGVPLAIVLALAGRTGMAAGGFAVGRRGGRLLDHAVRAEERARADELLRRHGTLAIVLTRPVPLLAETVAVLAGASPLPWSRALLAALVGSLLEAIAYSLAGAVAASFKNAALIWISVLLVAALVWAGTRWAERRPLTTEGGAG